MIKLRTMVLAILIIIVAGLLLPQQLVMPVEGATKTSYNQESYWYYPWGRSITHKGVDIFAKKGTAVRSSTNGFVLYCGQIEMGGNVVLVLGPKWRLHYYAHLEEIKTTPFSWASKDKIIGTVGTSGNAAATPPHLNYSILSAIPYFLRADNGIQGWMKMFYLNPIEYLEKQ